MSDNKFVPPVSPKMYKAVSDYRRSTLEGEVKQGKFRDGTGRAYDDEGISKAGFVSTSIKKMGQATQQNTVGSQWRGSSDNTVRQVQSIYNPLWLNSNMNLPRDRATLNAWCRSFFALQPPVHNAINLHSTYPISKLNIKCPNKKVERFFNDMIEEIDLLNVCVQVAQEYWLLGEAFVYAELDERTAKWSRLVLQNPDYIVVKRSPNAGESLIMLRPDENLRRIVFSNRPADIEQRRQLNETIIDHVKRGENIPLDNFYVSHLARKISPYETRGTGLPVCCFRQLMIFDWLREAKLVQAQSMVNPLTIVKVGTDGPEGLHPLQADLEAWRNVFEQAESDLNFKIFTHSGVSVERVGFGQGIYDTSGDITQLLKEIYMGLMVPQIIMEGGGDITYANGGVSLDVLRDRYMSFRHMMSAWLRKKIFAPISKLNEFYEHEDGEKKLIIPDIDWNHMSIFDSESHINMLSTLAGEQKKLSHQTLYRSLGLDYDDERRKMKKEDIAEAIRKKEMMSLERMPLNELRSMSDEDEIPEIAEPALPNQSPYTDQGGLGGTPLPGMEGAAPMGSGLGGSLPPLPGGPEMGLTPPPPSPGAPAGGAPPA